MMKLRDWEGSPMRSPTSRASSFLRDFLPWMQAPHASHVKPHERQGAFVQKSVVIFALLLTFIAIIFILSHEPTIPEETGVVQQLESLAQDGGFNATLIEELEQNAEASIRGRRKKLHSHFLDQIRAKKDVDVILMGDSITEGWSEQPEVFSHMVAGLGRDITVWNFGVSGDRTAQVVWRLINGELPGTLFVKVMVLTIGVNDLNSLQSPELTALQVKTLVRWLAMQRPRMSIVLCGILPTSWQNPDPPRGPPAEVNAELSKLDGLNQGRVTFVNCTSLFLTSDGNLDSSMYLEDQFMALHLNKKGYEAWAQCLLPSMKAALGKGRT